MRDIRFREWDQAREDMIPGHGMSYSEREEFDDSVSFRFEHEEDLDYTGRQSETDCHGTPYRVLEQYTGVDDVNGNPVYEGDIVKVYRQWTDEVGFINGSFGLFPNRYHPFVSLDELNGAMELLGNIHENPELLEAD